MTFKVTVVYQIKNDGPAMSRELSGIEKIERTWERIAGENVEVLRAYYSHEHNWATWGIGGILAITMIPEFKAE